VFLLPWVAAALLAGAGLLAAQLLTALAAGARDAAVHTAVLAGSGDLTLQPAAIRAGTPGPHLLPEAAVIFTNPALMRVPGRLVPRVEVRVEVARVPGGPSVSADLTGSDTPGDPQVSWLKPYLANGTWPAPGEAPGTGVFGVVVGAGLADRLGLKRGDPAWVFVRTPQGQRAWRGRVDGVLHTGLPSLDGARLWSSLAAAKALVSIPEEEWEDAATRLAVYLDAPRDAALWLDAILRLTLPEGVEILTWRQANPDALPWVAWQRMQRRVNAASSGAMAVGSLLGALLASRSWRRRSGPAWVILLPWAGGVLVAEAVAMAVVAHSMQWPWPSERVFASLGTDLNPFGFLTGPVALHLGLLDGLPAVLGSFCVFLAVTAGALWIAGIRTLAALGIKTGTPRKPARSP
jgi:hypothetical protein